jgi:Mor family transcriptional regulator
MNIEEFCNLFKTLEDASNFINQCGGGRRVKKDQIPINDNFDVKLERGTRVFIPSKKVFFKYARRKYIIDEYRKTNTSIKELSIKYDLTERAIYDILKKKDS